MTAELALSQQPLAEQWKYAQALAQAGLLPRQYRDSPGDVLLAMAYAESLNIPVAQIFTGIHVIEGKPSMSAELMGALVRRAGHRIRMSGNGQQAMAEIVRSDDPTFTYRASFTLADAQRAGLLGKDVWKKYPAAMLLARAVSAVCRAGAADVLAGVSYVPEELGDVPDWIEEASAVSIEPAPVAQAAESVARTVEQPSEPEPIPQEAEPVKRRPRRTKAEMEAARAEEKARNDARWPVPEQQDAARAADQASKQMHHNTHQAVNEYWDQRQAGPNEQQTGIEVVDAEPEVELLEQEEADWLIDLEQAIDHRDEAAIGVLGSKAATWDRHDLVKMARLAWNDVHSGVAPGPA